MISDRKLIVNTIKLEEQKHREGFHYPEELGAMEAALWYLFRSYNENVFSKYLNNGDLFGNEPLTRKQKSTLKMLLESFKWVALKHGFIAKYNEVIGEIHPIQPAGKLLFLVNNNFWIVAAVVYVCIQNNNFWLATFLIPWFWIEAILPQFSDQKKDSTLHNDYIVQQVNKEHIERDELAFKWQLITLGWIRSKLPNKFTQELLKNSKTYWDQWHLNNLSFCPVKVLDEDSFKKLDDLFNKVRAKIEIGEYSFETLFEELTEIDLILVNPFAAFEQLNSLRDSYLKKLGELRPDDTKYHSMIKNVKVMRDIYIKVNFDQERVEAYRTFFEDSYGSFVQKLIRWSHSEEGLKRLAKFTGLNSIELDELKNLLGDSAMFKDLAQRLVSKSLQALVNHRLEVELSDEHVSRYLVKFKLLVESLEGRKKILSDLEKLHQIHLVYTKMMFNEIEQRYWTANKRKAAELDLQIIKLLQEFLQRL